MRQVLHIGNKIFNQTVSSMPALGSFKCFLKIGDAKTIDGDDGDNSKIFAFTFDDCSSDGTNLMFEIKAKSDEDNKYTLFSRKNTIGQYHTEDYYLWSGGLYSTGLSNKGKLEVRKYIKFAQSKIIEEAEAIAEVEVKAEAKAEAEEKARVKANLKHAKARYWRKKSEEAASLVQVDALMLKLITGNDENKEILIKKCMKKNRKLFYTRMSSDKRTYRVSHMRCKEHWVRGMYSSLLKYIAHEYAFVEKEKWHALHIVLNVANEKATNVFGQSSMKMATVMTALKRIFNKNGLHYIGFCERHEDTATINVIAFAISVPVQLLNPSRFNDLWPYGDATMKVISLPAAQSLMSKCLANVKIEQQKTLLTATSMKEYLPPLRGKYLRFGLGFGVTGTTIEEIRKEASR